MPSPTFYLLTFVAFFSVFFFFASSSSFFSFFLLFFYFFFSSCRFLVFFCHLTFLATPTLLHLFRRSLHDRSLPG